MYVNSNSKQPIERMLKTRNVMVNSNLKSTSVIARGLNVDSKLMFQNLMKRGYLIRKGREYVLTSKGYSVGGTYGRNDQGDSWVLWDFYKITEALGISSEYVDLASSIDSIRKRATSSISKLSQIDKDRYRRGLERGTAILSSELLLDRYTYSFAEMHFTKLRMLFNSGPLSGIIDSVFNSCPVDIIDYGCGQGFASIGLLSHLKNVGIVARPKSATLIEPSSFALQRATRYLAGNLVPHNVDFDSLSPNMLPGNGGATKIHLLSNVLDMGGDKYSIDALAATIKQSMSGVNYFLCVGAFKPENMKYFASKFPGAIDIYKENTELLLNSGKPCCYVAHVFKVEV